MSRLYLAWRQPDQRWWPVGQLQREGSDYVFTYTRGAVSAAKFGFRPLVSFPDFDEVYVSRDLFSVFANRLPPRSRPDHGDFVEWLDVGTAAATDPLVLLARSGGRRETDMFELFPEPVPSSDGRYESVFFVHGLRHRGPAAEDEARRLAPGDPLRLEAEPGNPEDSRAVRVVAVTRGAHLGFVPRYLCGDYHALTRAAASELEVRVRRVNLPPSPAQFRLLCSLTAPWPPGFRSLSSLDFQALHALTPAGGR